MTEHEDNQNKQKKGISYSKLLIGFLLLILLFVLIAPHIMPTCNYKVTPYTKCCGNLKNISTALTMYATDNNENYPENLNLITGNYLRTIPTCAEAGKDTYSATYQVYNNPKKKIHRFTFYCGGHYHDKVGLHENYPQYTSEKGFIPR